MFEEAEEFIQMMHQELGIDASLTEKRLADIQQEISKTNTYQHTAEELEYGAKVAWRNSNRCIGRLFWDKLHVIDKRHLTTEEEMIEAVEHHIQYATNDGKLRPAITIFPQGEINTAPFVIVNDQLIRYSDDRIVQSTKQKIEMIQPVTTKFLPIMYRYHDTFNIHHLNTKLIKEVSLTHPNYPSFDTLDLKWYAIPIISAMDLKIGGVTYATAPFNGWYMESEIASRNLLDSYRYDLIETIAQSFNFDTSTTATYWRDRTLVELNYAVYHSFKQAGVSIVDHYTASKQFEKFEQNEEKAGRHITGDWTWLIPPISPSLVHNFHKGYDNTYRNPNFHYRKKGCPMLNT